jgi:cadmium resistance protein CadD (predicted permease)
MGTVGAAVVLFAGTNVDDLVVLTVLFLAGRATGRPRPWQIWAGQYAGSPWSPTRGSVCSAWSRCCWGCAR